MDGIYSRAVKSGIYYFARIVGLGFALGTLRVLWLVPMMGETNAVLAEQPIMLIASWFVARCLVRRQRLLSICARGVMGVTAFTLLMLAEVILASVLSGQAPAEWLRSIFAMPGIIGLAGQVLFALMPVLMPVDRASSQQSSSQ
jgi:hypothetical protein